MDNFQYSPLERQHIRLLKLDLGGSPDETLSASLVDIRLTRALGAYRTDVAGTIRNWHDTRYVTKGRIRHDGRYAMEAREGYGYDALSYTWGPVNPDTDHKLNIYSTGKKYARGKLFSDGKTAHQGTVTIRENLFLLLAQLRQMKYSRFIWIDSICINQADDAEKGSQIALMGEVYRNATHVIIWLGPATEDERAALGIMSELSQKLRLAKELKIDLDPANTQGFSQLGLPHSSHPHWSAFGTLMSRTWFRRQWTLQEAVLPSRLPKFMLGDIEVEWYTIAGFSEAMKDCPILMNWSLTGDRFEGVDFLDGFKSIRMIEWCRLALAKRALVGVPLFFLLQASSGRETSQPADCILGFLGMAEPGLVEGMTIDVSLPHKDVFVAFAKYYIQHETRECLLNHTSRAEALDHLPSWVPNFASQTDTVSLGSPFNSGPYVPKILDSQRYCAGFPHSQKKWRVPDIGKTHFLQEAFLNVLRRRETFDIYNSAYPRQISLVDGTGFIRVSGMWIDTVAEAIGSTQDDIDLQLGMPTDFETLCLDLARTTLKCADEEIPEVYWRTLITNMTLDDTVDPNIIWDRYDQVDRLPQYLKFKNWLMASVNSNRSVEYSELDHRTLAFAGCFRRATDGRCFFSTQQGRIGLGPKNTKVGDQLCVFFYCPTPYLLRDEWESEAKSFIGETYVHRLMYGEALGMLEKGELEETQFLIG